MNATAVTFPSLGCNDFDGSIAANSIAAARSYLRPLETASLVTVPAFLSGAFAPMGIAAYLAQIVIGRSAHLSPSLRQRIVELSDLRPNWDGEKAKVIKSHVLADVIEVLMRFARRAESFREPFLAPTFEGFVQMEWHDKRRSLEIEAVNHGWSLVGTTIGQEGKRDYFTAACERSGFQELETFYGWFLGAELIWPSQ
jgi:hypothetical protein